jgi:glucose 1-dehydrogenase
MDSHMRGNDDDAVFVGRQIGLGRKRSVSLTMKLQGQTAVISGGLGDIGRAVAIELARRGAQISLGDVKPAEEARPLLDQLGAQAIYTQVDIRDAQAVEHWMDVTEKRLGLPTLIISNAGIVTRASIMDITTEQWNNEFDVNVGGALNLCRQAARKLIKEGIPGKIVLLGSWAAHRPNKAIPAYCASKAALRMLGEILAVELAAHNIAVNELALGVVHVGLSADNLIKMPPEVIAAKNPAGQWIKPEDVAWQVAHLCDPCNTNMTGSVVVMDGGLSLTSQWT